MPARQKKSKPDKSVKATDSAASSKSGFALWQNPIFVLLAGAVAGLSAPGLEQWYLAWFGLAPLFLAIYGTQSLWRQVLSGFLFGLGYNLVYLHWYLGLYPLDWMGYPGVAGAALTGLAWILVSGHQALIIALFALIAGRLPICAGYTFKNKQIPALSFLPLLWILVVNKIGNAPGLLGVPWSMLEYTQYRQNMLIQGASVFGGIGLCFVLIAANVAIASLIATFANLKQCKLAAPNKDAAFYYVLGTALLMGAFVLPGLIDGSKLNVATDKNVVILEGAINIDMQKSSRKVTLEDILSRYESLLANTGSADKDSLIVMPEGSLPLYLIESDAVVEWLKKTAIKSKADMVVGAMDREVISHPYNAAFGITSSGLLASEKYHKRYLVPLGEYTPLFVSYLPKWIRDWTNTPSGTGFSPGKEANLLNLNMGAVGPLICFESISPELTAASCRAGAQILVNISDLAWFHKSNCGQQMLAFGVFRAVENRRSFVFAANTGPSALIDARGLIKEYPQEDTARVVLGKAGLNSRISPFTLWYR
ncbi:MAG: Apolipoprotein N-acyltransferase [Cyanobacteriota bacterium erpe_2018_sw_39hr_WHONDRS-SW48-000098_B_bin.30]|jgi:apolipoprotein N-acyltransferase|nr:apolipoprotein N-acyltransferase [Candidatus Obscuribacter sp.]MBK7838978.1 apolipoprotein N-acyltransferase [Candidatus Obscuribacter sp.]MDQ5967706.1 Apolipoprotein N-acyltransferase [Cyanobacteriota bacterium erpe_2018_sw_39hr_WHONDRS-SW48-000098_B_bin.30]